MSKRTMGTWLLCVAAAAGCGDALPTVSVGLATQPLLAAAGEHTCLRGRYTLELSSPEQNCTAVPGWSVSKQRRARFAADGGSAPRVALTQASCVYAWLGAGEPAEPAVPAATQICLDEPALQEAEIEASCPHERLIGFRPDDVPDCQSFEAQGIHGRALFEGHTQGLLGRYCLYSRTPEAADLPLPAWVHSDCNAVGQHAEPDRRRAREQAFLEAVEAAPSFPRLRDGSLPEPVDVQVLDSAFDRRDDGMPGHGHAPHGRTMAVMIARLACPRRDASSACLADVRNRLALLLERTADGIVRNPRGGSLGAAGDLATAIVESVDAATPGRHAILNLSLGWTKAWGGGEAQETVFLPQVRAVFHALQYARCKAALVIAAAGNTRGTQRLPVGPVFPARWTERPAPSAERCAELGVTDAQPSTGPLLFSAGAVSNSDRALHNTPLQGRPPLAAPGWLAVVADPAPIDWEPGGGYTGSSVAAAVTTATAAVIWGYGPRLTPDQVMAQLYATGVDLGVAADFCPGGQPCPNIHRVSVCAAAQRACAQGRCEFAPNCVADAAPRSLPELRHDQARFPERVCDDTDADACARRANRGLPPDRSGVPVLYPQPDTPICEDCLFGVDGLVLDLNSNPNNVEYNFWFEGLQITDSLGTLAFDANPDVGFSGGDSLQYTVSGLPRALSYPVSEVVGTYWYDGPGWLEQGEQAEPWLLE